MYHRTYGQTKDCRGCRYWSEMIAKANGGGPVRALCLSPKSERRGKYTTGLAGCVDWASGEYGAIDEPGDPSDQYDPYAEVL